MADPLARYRMVTERNNKNLLDAHHAFWPSVAEMEDGNPTLLLMRGETRAAGLKLPPLLVLQGTNDDNLTPDMADRLVAAWLEPQVGVTFKGGGFYKTDSRGGSSSSTSSTSSTTRWSRRGHAGRSPSSRDDGNGCRLVERN